MLFDASGNLLIKAAASGGGTPQQQNYFLFDTSGNLLVNLVSGGGGGVTSISGDGTIITNSASTGAVTLTIAGTSGGIPYFSSASGWASSALLASGGLVLGGGAGSAPSTSTQLTFSAPTLTVGLAGTSSGILALAGSTSGTATLTAPAVAGTTTNPIVFSNAIQIASSSALSVAVQLGASSVGLSNDGSNDLYLLVPTGKSVVFRYASTNVYNFGSGSLSPNSDNQVGIGSANNRWTSIFLSTSVIWTNGSGTADTNLSRVSAGVVGVGTGGAGSVAGTLQATIFNATNGFQSGGTAGVSAGNFTTVTSITTVGGLVTVLSGTSDERLKDSKSYNGGLKEILSITPVRYHWNRKGQEHTGLPADREYVGFLAQNVQEIIPEAITAKEKSKDGLVEYLSLDDRPILAAVVNAVKELSARISQLEAKYDAA